ncbi:hypothetical protein IFM89_037916 [Coptis chinensis]|uniref:Uncharacterized protein n=1 Tax=Coptis chinensis TaxID=261450 RepID=A0A835IJM8_9MAGN|nr:hypothetical protein IFM89_037916 [Coptis chinensis]
MFAALFSKLGVAIKTTVSATVLEEALNGAEAQAGLVCRVQSSDKSKFKLFYFEPEDNGGLSLASQEESAKIRKCTSAGMYFFVFLFTGTYVFSVYGDNFFKSASYVIEVLCAGPFSKEKDKLRDVEARILTKRVELSKFETKYREVLAQFTEMASRYVQEMQAIDELLKQRNTIHASYSTAPPLKRSSSSSKSSDSFKESKKEEECQTSHKKHWANDRPKKSKWFNVRLKMDKDKPC